MSRGGDECARAVLGAGEWVRLLRGETAEEWGRGQDHAVRQREELHWKLKENE